MTSMRKLNRRLLRWQRYASRYRPGLWPRNYNVVRCDVRDPRGFERAYNAVQHEQERRCWDEMSEIHLVGLPDDDYGFPPYVVPVPDISEWRLP
jgi:hypothetical protein